MFPLLPVDIDPGWPGPAPVDPSLQVIGLGPQTKGSTLVSLGLHLADGLL
jgi:hypothetical protein